MSDTPPNADASLKPEKISRMPVKIDPFSASEMVLEWSTGEKFQLPFFDLRFECPCANCVDEHTGKRVLRREQVKVDVRPIDISLVGRYAIQIRWDDKHSTGIYHFDTLWGICDRVGLRLDL